MDPREGTVGLLAEFQSGDHSALARLFPLVYDELRSLAARYLDEESPSPVLQATAVVHEAFLKLVHQEDAAYRGRTHFLAVAAMAMRRVLVDHARRRRARKRGGQNLRVTLHDGIALSKELPLDVLTLDDALERLATLDPRHARIIELRFFAGLTNDEVAQVIGVSTRTVEDDWRVARAWLRRELSREEQR